MSLADTLVDISHESALNKAERMALRRIAIKFEQLQAENAKLKRVLVGDTHYSLLSCLDILIDAAKHLLEVHNCDSHGYERIGIVRDAAIQHRSNIIQALKKGE